jgi:hypothetical protein
MAWLPSVFDHRAYVRILAKSLLVSVTEIFEHTEVIVAHRLERALIMESVLARSNPVKLSDLIKVLPNRFALCLLRGIFDPFVFKTKIDSFRAGELLENADKCVYQTLLVFVFKPLNICRVQNSF